jgi:large subunit ribosomal protein L28
MGNIRRKVTTAKPMFGNHRSFSMHSTRRKFNPNMQNKRFFVPELDKWVRLRVSTSEMKTIDKIGLRAFLKRRGFRLESLA